VSKVTLAADTAWVQNRAPDLSLGVEWRAVEPLALRVGGNEREITAGIGVLAGGAGFDYAFGFPNGRAVRDELGTSHRFSVHFSFGRNVLAGSYRDLAQRREEKRQEIIVQDAGVDRVKVLRRRMEDWDGRMNPETFAQVQAARRSLRTLAFSDPDKSLEAQAYISHFQGRFDQSARLFDRLTELHPRSRRLRRHAEVAHKRQEELGQEQVAIAAAYDKMDAAEREREAIALENRRREIELAAAEAAEQQRAIAGGAGGSTGGTVEESGSVEPEGRTQVAFLPAGQMPAPFPPQLQPARPAIPQQPPARAVPPPVERPAEPLPPPAEEETVPAPEPPARSAEPQPDEQPVPPAQPQPPAAAPAVPTEKPELQEARRQFEAGDYVASHLLTRRVLEQDPTDRVAARQAILTSAVVSAEAAISDPKESVDMARIEREVDRSIMLFERAQALNKRRKREDALLVLEQAILTCPANFMARNLSRQINADIEDERWRKILNDSRRG
jgi:hypothetical protein